MQDLNKVIAVFVLFVVAVGVLWFLLNRTSSVRSLFSFGPFRQNTTSIATPSASLTTTPGALLKNTQNAFEVKPSPTATPAMAQTAQEPQQKGGALVTQAPPAITIIPYGSKPVTTYPATGAELFLLVPGAMGSLLVGMRLKNRSVAV